MDIKDICIRDPYPNDSPLERAVIYRIEENGAEIKLSEWIE